jgi:hypothetical protein
MTHDELVGRLEAAERRIRTAHNRYVGLMAAQPGLHAGVPRCRELEDAMRDVRQVREAIAALRAQGQGNLHLHSKRCYATGAGDTEVLVCGLAETQREKDPIKRLHNLVDSLQRCDRCEAEIGDGDTTVLCDKCAASERAQGQAWQRRLAEIDHPWEFYGTHDSERCFFCGRDRIGSWAHDDADHHASDCLWLSARSPLPAPPKQER